MVVAVRTIAVALTALGLAACSSGAGAPPPASPSAAATSAAPPSSASSTPTSAAVPTPPPFTAEPSGLAAFDDDFSDPRIGWPVGGFGRGSIVAKDGHLRITVADDVLGWIREPTSRYDTVLGFSATFALPRANPSDFGAGLACLTGSGGSRRVVYFLYQPVGFWLVEEVTAEGTPKEKARVLGKGNASQRSRGGTFHVSAGCQWQPGGTTRLTMLLDKKVVWSEVVTEPGAYGDGWRPALGVASSGRGTAVVDVTRWTKYFLDRN
jgi:hypothetical protein